MKEGRTLQELVSEVIAQRDLKRDYLVETPALSLIPADAPEAAIALDVKGHDSYPLTRHAETQLRESVGIRADYWERMRAESHKDFFGHTVNYWLKNEPSVQLLRTLGPQGRAYLSNGYRMLDHIDLLSATLPTLTRARSTQLIFRSMEVTDTKLYLKIISPDLEGEVRKGDIVRGGVVISNSEIGIGAVSVAPFIERLVCTNGACVMEFAKRQRHLGRRIDTTELVEELYSDETRQKADAAFWSGFRDIIEGLFSMDVFNRIIDSMRAATERRMNPLVLGDSVKVLANRHQLPEDESSRILANLITSGDLTQYGLAQAVTNFAESARSYDHATELEAIGGSVLTLGPEEWRVIAEPEAVPARKRR